MPFCPCNWLQITLIKVIKHILKWGTLHYSKSAVPQVHDGSHHGTTVYTKLFFHKSHLLTWPLGWREVSHPPLAGSPALRWHVWRSRASGIGCCCRRRRTTLGDSHSILRAVLRCLCDWLQLHSKNSNKSSNRWHLLQIYFDFLVVWPKKPGCRLKGGTFKSSENGQAINQSSIKNTGCM